MAGILDSITNFFSDAGDRRHGIAHPHDVACPAGCRQDTFPLVPVALTAALGLTLAYVASESGKASRSASGQKRGALESAIWRARDAKLAATIEKAKERNADLAKSAREAEENRAAGWAKLVGGLETRRKERT